MANEIINTITSLVTFIACGIWIYLSWRINIKVKYMEDLHKNLKLKHDTAMTFILSQLYQNSLANENYELCNKIKNWVNDIDKITDFELIIKNK